MKYIGSIMIFILVVAIIFIPSFIKLTKGKHTMYKPVMAAGFGLSMLLTGIAIAIMPKKGSFMENLELSIFVYCAILAIIFTGIGIYIRNKEKNS